MSTHSLSTAATTIAEPSALAGNPAVQQLGRVAGISRHRDVGYLVTAFEDHTTHHALRPSRRAVQCDRQEPTAPERTGDMTIYRLTDRLHHERCVYVPENRIGATVAAWLAELGADSPLVEDLALAVRCGDWPTAHRLADYLSVQVSVAA